MMEGINSPLTTFAQLKRLQRCQCSMMCTFLVEHVLALSPFHMKAGRLSAQCLLSSGESSASLSGSPDDCTAASPLVSLSTYSGKYRFPKFRLDEPVKESYALIRGYHTRVSLSSTLPTSRPSPFQLCEPLLQLINIGNCASRPIIASFPRSIDTLRLRRISALPFRRRPIRRTRQVDFWPHIIRTRRRRSNRNRTLRPSEVLRRCRLTELVS